jgi:hypothetical protein
LYLTEVLPLVEFFLEEDINDDEANSLLDLEPAAKDKDKNSWQESNIGSILPYNTTGCTGNVKSVPKN